MSKYWGVVPGSDTGLLSEPHKMRVNVGDKLAQVWSWSLPAVKSCPGAHFQDHDNGHEAICGRCYADNTGSYSWPIVQAAQAARFAWAVKCTATVDGQEEFVTTMVSAIDRAARKTRRFRIHDSGDFFNPVYLRLWARIARALPWVTFWAPTRTWRFRDRKYWREAFDDILTCQNIVLRPSSLYFDEPAPMLDGFAAGTTAHTTGTPPAGEAVCNVYENDAHSCGTCTRCWDRPDVAVSYAAH